MTPTGAPVKSSNQSQRFSHSDFVVNDATPPLQTSVRREENLDEMEDGDVFMAILGDPGPKATFSQKIRP